jgi:purine-binding chemotaxis protein CheW
MDERSGLLICRVRGRLCALPLAHVNETMRPLPIEPTLGAPPFVRGLALIRGRPTPVIDVAALLGDTSKASDPSSRFVLVTAPNVHVALVVDEVVAIDRSLQNKENDAELLLPPILGPEFANVISTIGQRDSNLLLVLRALRLIPPTHRTSGSAV